jgi:hypothetical protein
MLSSAGKSSAARTTESAAVADGTSISEPMALQPPTAREFHPLLMSNSKLPRETVGEEHNPRPAWWNCLVNKRFR